MANEQTKRMEESSYTRRHPILKTTWHGNNNQSRAQDHFAMYIEQSKAHTSP